MRKFNTFYFVYRDLNSKKDENGNLLISDETIVQHVFLTIDELINYVKTNITNELDFSEYVLSYKNNIQKNQATNKILQNINNITPENIIFKYGDFTTENEYNRAMEDFYNTILLKVNQIGEYQIDDYSIAIIDKTVKNNGLYGCYITSINNKINPDKINN